MWRRNRILLSVGIVLTILAGARIALPHVIETFLNRQLAALDGYAGQIDDIDLAIWRGAIAADGVHIVRTTDADEQEAFFDCDRMQLSLEWRSLLKGALVAEGEIIRPVVNLVQSADEDEQQLGTETRWPTFLADLYPFDINTIRIRDGTVRLRTTRIASDDALIAHGIEASVDNLTNVADRNEETFANFSVDATVFADAPLRVRGSVDPIAETPTFDVNLELERVNLKDLNAWLREYVGADAQAGTFQLYLEIAAADGRFAGYAKPLMQDVDIYGADDRDDNVLRKAWEGIVEFATNLVENDAEKQVAARIPLRGTIDDPSTNIWETIGSVLSNAFVGAFARSLEGSISLRRVRKNLSEIGESSGVEEKEEIERRQRRRSG
jgi:hypothetical protein